MRLVPRSLFGRLLGIATLTTLAALAFAAFTIGNVLERFVMHGLDQQLDAEETMLARAMRADGTLDRARVVDLPEFETVGEGWGWRAHSARGTWTGGDPIDVAMLPPGPPDHEYHGPPDADAARPGEGVTQGGERVHARQITISTAAGPATITVSAPRHLAVAPLREAMAPLLGSLALLGAGLALATLLQLRFGLGPLRSLRSALADVRAGRLARLPLDQPYELAPVVAELNALIDQNEAGLEHARRHVANLAHGLKTPLAALSLKLADAGRDPDGELAARIAEIDRQIRHHLGRARAAAPAGATRTRTLLAPAIADLATVLERIHAERRMNVTINVASQLAVTIDPQDLSEMLGNLLDNAWRHARATIALHAVTAGSAVVLTIDDDGPGIPEAALAGARARGRRLDERGDGHGFGLPIAEELADLNGGSLALARSPLGGLRVTVALPGSQVIA